jgi:hypothetical protein
MEKYNDLIGIRTCDLLVCSIVPQPTMLPCAPVTNSKQQINLTGKTSFEKNDILFGPVMHMLQFCVLGFI